MSHGLSSNLFRPARLVALMACVALTGGCALADALDRGNRYASTLKKIDVLSEKGETRIVIEGSRSITYTAYKQMAPWQIIVDINDARLGSIREPIRVDNDLVKAIIPSQPKAGSGLIPFVRMKVMLKEDANYDVFAADEKLTLRISPTGSSDATLVGFAGEGDGPMAASEGPSEIVSEGTIAETHPIDLRGEDAGDATEPPVAVIEEQAAGALEEIPIEPATEREQYSSWEGEAEADGEAELEPAQEATEVYDIATAEIEGGTEIAIIADGRVADYEAMMLDDPPRLVIDLWDVSGFPGSREFYIGSPEIDRVRVGNHPDKVRFVFDAPGEMLAQYRIARSGNRLLVRFGEDAPPPFPESMPVVARAETFPEAGPEAGSEAEDADSGREIEIEYSTDEAAAGTASEQVEASADEVKAGQAETAAETAIGQAEAPAEETPVESEIKEAEKETTPVEKKVVPAERPKAEATPAISAPASEPERSIPRPKTETPKPLAQAKRPASTGREEPQDDPFEQVASVQLLQPGGYQGDKIYTGRKISLDFKDVDIKNILRLIAEVSGLNIIASDDVSGSVTIRLVNVPWDQALDIILLSKGLGFVRVGNIVRVAPGEVLKREEEQRLADKRSREKVEDLIVKLQPVNYASAGELVPQLQKVMTERGTVELDSRTNTLILKDIPAAVEEAIDLVKALDTPTPQVLIEAKLVEARLEYRKALGAFVTADFLNPDIAKGGVDIKRSLDFGNRTPAGAANDTSGLVSNLPIPITFGTPTGTFDVALTALRNSLDMDIFIEALESSGHGRTISSPRVTTLDNVEAKIVQGVAIPFQTLSGDTFGTTTEFIDALLELKVTPHVTSDRSIIMKIIVKRDSPSATVQLNDGTPGIDKNEAKTEAMVRDGQTIVIGGIYVVNKNRDASSFPFFGKIPIIKFLFNNERYMDDKRELIVFVTPRIIPHESGQI